METAIIVVLVALCVRCAWGWYLNSIITKAFAEFINEKCSLPTDKELRDCIYKVLKKKSKDTIF